MSKNQFYVKVTTCNDVANDVLMEVYPLRFNKSKSLLNAEIK